MKLSMSMITLSIMHKCAMLYYINSNRNYYLVMEDGGSSLFDFVVKMHQFVESKRLNIDELHSVSRIIFQQMIEAIEYIHSKGIAHMDISLENWLIDDLGCCFFSHLTEYQRCLLCS